ncbi:MAG: GntR family transcriptional regulator [Gammaproteobacteria bacterium]|nr:GntR family transcriptional regulator [Gammaproteobacteria bacterium]
MHITLADRIFARLQREIVEGTLKPGSKISEPELARSYGISRGPLREAIGRLEACSLVVRKPNVGARVVSLSADQLLEIYHVREALEGMAARLAATAMSEAEIDDLAGLLHHHRAQVERDPSQGYVQKEGDLDFHYRLVQGSKNRRLIQLLCNDLYHLVRLYRHQFGVVARAQRALVEHEHVVAALAERDGEMAELLMRHHIRATRANAMRRIAEREVRAV